MPGLRDLRLQRQHLRMEPGQLRRIDTAHQSHQLVHALLPRQSGGLFGFAVHHLYHFGAALVYDCFAGSVQNTSFLRDTGLPGPEPNFYFAPVQIRKRNADWGHAEVNRKFNEAQLAFIRRISKSSQPWMALQEHAGFEAAQRLIADLHAGRIDPSEGHVVVLT